MFHYLTHLTEVFPLTVPPKCLPMPLEESFIDEFRMQSNCYISTSINCFSQSLMDVFYCFTQIECTKKCAEPRVKFFQNTKTQTLKKKKAMLQHKITLSSVSCYFLICVSSFILIGAVLFLNSCLLTQALLLCFSIPFHHHSHQ